MALAIAVPAAAQPISAAGLERSLVNVNETLLVDPVRAATMAKDIRKAALALKDQRRRVLIVAGADRIIAECALRLDDFTTARREIDSSIDILGRVAEPTKAMADALLTRGGVNAGTGRTARALADYQAAFRRFRRIGDARSQAVALLLIAILYNDARDNGAALRYLTQATDLANGDLRLAVVIANNRGNALQDLGRHAEADAAFVRAHALAQQLPGKFLRAQVMGNIARGRLASGNIDGAEKTIADALPLTRSGEAAAWRPQLLAIAAEVALRRHRLQPAERFIRASFAGVDLTKTTNTGRVAHDTAYRIFAALDRPAEALAHLVALKRLDDEATKLATNSSTALMGARFDFANQELRIERLRAAELRRTVAAEQEKSRFTRLIVLIGAGATTAIIALLAWLLFTIRRSRNSIRKANNGLAVTNAALGKAVAARTEFLATTSHEIRTPLNGILGMTQVMLADQALAPDVRDRVGVVHAAGLSMRMLVDDILDVAKLETGKLTIDRAPFDLCATLRGATPLWEAQCAEKGLAFEARLGDCPAVIQGDAMRVRQIVFNLLANAVKFTAHGRVTLAVRADRAAGTVEIAIGDTGIGIDPAQQSAIFEAFRQADASTTRRFGGTGLGLSISRSLAEAMGGSVAVESVVGDGATFTLSLPLVEEHGGSTKAGAVGEAAVDLLVLDRNPITRAMIRSLVAPRVDSIGFVADERGAIEAIHDGRIAQLLVDDASIGADLAVAARIAQAARAADVPIILLWPGDRQEEHATLAVAGVTRIVARPYAGGALIDAIDGSRRALVRVAA